MEGALLTFAFICFFSASLLSSINSCLSVAHTWSKLAILRTMVLCRIVRLKSLAQSLRSLALRVHSSQRTLQTIHTVLRQWLLIPNPLL